MILGTSLPERGADASDRYIHAGSRARRRIRKVGAIVADYPPGTRKGWVKPTIRQKISSFVADPKIGIKSVNKSTSREIHDQ
jgi:hypothetical protein